MDFAFLICLPLLVVSCVFVCLSRRCITWKFHSISPVILFAWLIVVFTETDDQPFITDAICPRSDKEIAFRLSLNDPALVSLAIFPKALFVAEWIFKHTRADTHSHFGKSASIHNTISMFQYVRRHFFRFDCALKMAMWLSGINMSADCLPLTRHFLSTHIPPFECWLDEQTKKQKQINWERLLSWKR